MNHLKTILATVFLAAFVPISASAFNADRAFHVQERIVMHLVGAGRPLTGSEVARLVRVAARAGVHMAPEVCFDVPLKNLETGLPLGKGFSCLEQINILGDGSFFTLVETGIFQLRGGKLVVQGELTGGALLNGDNDPSSGITHVTGSFPTQYNVFGTGIFKHVTGRSRVSGGLNIVNMEKPIFNCIFSMDLFPETYEYR
ncbi:MAG: hypothetical protein ACR2RL_22505 [Gammaproteobacteria bacterium]